MTPDTSIPKLEVKRVVDSSTGEWDTHYYLDGHRVPKVQIKGKLVDRLSGLTLIAKDLANALKWIKQAEVLATESKDLSETGYFHAKDRDKFDNIKAYFVASLTFYGKCFTEAAGRHAQVSIDWIDNEEYRELHGFYMSYRHNFAAHSGDESLEMARTYVLVHPNRKTILPYLPTLRMQPDIALPNHGDLGFSDLIEYVAAKVTEKYNKLADKIVKESILPKGLKYWALAGGQKTPIELEPPKKSKKTE